MRPLQIKIRFEIASIAATEGIILPVVLRTKNEKNDVGMKRPPNPLQEQELLVVSISADPAVINVPSREPRLKPVGKSFCGLYVIPINERISQKHHSRSPRRGMFAVAEAGAVLHN